MKEYQINFLVNNKDASAYVAQPLHRLAKKFKSTLHIINITHQRRAQLGHSLAMHQVGLAEGDLCQICIVGIDAELTCFVIQDIIAEHYLLIGNQIDHAQYQQLRTLLALPAKIHWHHAQAPLAATKLTCLQQLATLISPESADKLALAFVARETASSTCIAPGIALPHVMCSAVEDISIALLRSAAPIDWDSRIGAVELAIALLVPRHASAEQLRCVTNVTRNLLAANISASLLNTQNSAHLQVLMMYLMSRLLT